MSEKTVWRSASMEGKWKDGKKNGQGIFTSSTGSRYVGEFSDDKRNI